MSNHPRYAGAKNHKITMNADTNLTASSAVGSNPASSTQHPSSLAAPSILQPSRPSPTERGSTNPPIHAPDPEPWPQPVDGNLLLDELARTLTRFVVLPACAPQALALWVLHTYAFQLRDVSAYVGIQSPEKRCGKTTLLSILEQLVHRPVASSNISPAAFFRVIKDLSPTLLIDEADTFLRNNDQLKGILNSGYTRQTAYVLRPASSSPSPSPNTQADAASLPCAVARFSCWCPKVMAAIGRLPDTLADRCILIHMQRKTQHEYCERSRLLDPAPLTRKCARFVQDHAAEIASALPDIPTVLNDRAADIWEPLLALADLAGGSWPATARHAAVTLAAASLENSLLGSLLLDIFVLFSLAQTDRLFTRDLLDGLNGGLASRPWMELRKGKEVTDIWLARQLRPYGIRPTTIWVGELQAKGYLKQDFHEAFRRYIPNSEIEALKAASTKPTQ